MVIDNLPPAYAPSAFDRASARAARGLAVHAGDRPHPRRVAAIGARWARFATCSLLLALVTGPGTGPIGCGSKGPDPTIDPGAVTVGTNMPRFLRNTVRFEADLLGYGPTLVRGYGLVVGLDGTGSNDTPIPIRAVIDREARLLQNTSRVSSDDELNVNELLNSLDTAVVLVEASIPPGAPAGTPFDVRVAALPSTSTTSLAGGRLWTTMLRRGSVNPGAPNTDAVASVNGDLFLNPFAESTGRLGLTIDEEGLDIATPEALEDDVPGDGVGLDRRVSPEEYAFLQESGVLSPEDLAYLEVDPALSDPTGGAEATDPDAAVNTDPIIEPAAPVREPRRGGVVVEQRIGRILGGGRTLTDMPLLLDLTTPSFSRSRAIANAINARFPQEPSQRRQTAVPQAGQSDSRIEITVPPSWRDRTDEFVETLMHTPIDRRALELRAQDLARWVKDNPIDAPTISWCWVALGEAALPSVRTLYDYSEDLPRIAALKAGAKLDDPLAVDALAAVALDPDNEIRLQAVELLGELSPSPRVSTILRGLLDDEASQIRVAAFTGLKNQGDPIVRRIPLGTRSDFALYSVPSRVPMVYAAQQGQPHLVLFGQTLALRRPLIASAWNDRLVLACDSHDEPVRVLYRERGSLDPQTFELDADLVEFIRFLGGHPGRYTPGPALGLNYSDTVGALYAIDRANGLTGRFVLERDALSSQIIAGARGESRRADRRPESGRRDSMGLIDQPVIVPTEEGGASPAEPSRRDREGLDRAGEGDDRNSVGSSTGATAPRGRPESGGR